MALDFDKVNSYSRGLKEKTQPRDNTRINSKLEPRLKKKEEKELPDNRTYLSQAPSKNIREANNLNHTLKQIQDFGDKLKQVGLDLRDYAAVGTSMLNPAAGMVLGLGDAGVSAAKGDYVSGGVQAGLEMLPGVGKGVKSVLSKKSNPMISKFIPQGGGLNDYKGIADDLERFYNYLSDPQTLKRLKDIDLELGTNYYNVANHYLDIAKSRPNKAVFPFSEELIPHMRDAGAAGIASPKREFLKNSSDPNNYRMYVLDKRSPSTTSHEVKHLLDFMELSSRLSDSEATKIFNNPKWASEMFDRIRNSPRIKKLLEDNVVDYETFKSKYSKSYYNTFGKYPTEKKLKERYDYLSDPFEVNSQLHPLVEERIRQGKPGVFDYRDDIGFPLVDEFERDLHNARKHEGETSLYSIYKYIVKDKPKFINTISKYGYATVPTAIGGATMLNNKNE